MSLFDERNKWVFLNLVMIGGEDKLYIFLDSVK